LKEIKFYNRHSYIKNKEIIPKTCIKTIHIQSKLENYIIDFVNK